MSSYRSSYTPFKSSLPSTYKSSTTSSSYSSRDDISGTSRYTSSALASPSSYRPSFSGGTYRLKRDTPTVSTTSSYVSRYTPSSSAAASSTTLAKADSSSSDMKSVSQLKRYGSTSSSIGKYSREPSPAALEHTNRMRSRDPSPGIRSLKGHSRDPSPGMDNKYKVGYGSSYRMNMPKTSTSASTPTTSSYSSTRYGATRTPSSTSVAEKTSTTRTASSTSLADKTKGYGATNRTPSTTSLAEKSLSYGTASARRTPSTTSLAEKPLAYGSSNARPTSSATSNISYGLSSRNSSSSIKPTEEKPLASEGRPRTTSNQSSISYLARDYQTNQNDIPQQVPVQVPQKCESPKTTNTPAKPMESKDDPLEEDEDSESTEESDTSEDDELPEPPKELFLSVTVCTRGTSPNPPGSQTSGRPTQSLAITIEKTILRSTSKRKMVEKEMQSEECTKVTRYGHNSRLSPFNPPAEKRRSPSNLRYSSSPLSTTSKSTSVTANDSRREDSTTSSSSPSRTTKTASPTTTKSKLSPPRVGRLKSRQSSVESLSPKKPPVGPKAESPFKSPSPSSLSPGPSRLPNKDFRKSSLNVGPTDRTRKSRTPSTGTDSDFNTIDALNGALQAIQRLERSPSACSEISVASNRSARLRNMSSENKLRPRCLSKTLGSRTPPSPLSRQNSNTSIKPVKSPLAASPLAMRSNKILVTAATSSSSGTESSAAEPKKPHKKIVKKKVVKLAQAPASSSTSTALSSTNNSDNQSSPTTSSTANKRSLPQPKAAVGGTSTAIPAAAATKKTESSPLKKSASTSSRTEKDPLRRLKKLSSVSNFFVAQQKNANSDDQIYLESTETSGGGSASGGGGGEATSTDLDVASTKSSKKSISLLRANETKTSKSTTPATPSNDSASSASNRNSPAVQYTRENSASERSTRISKSSAKSSTTSKSKTKSKSSSTSASTSSSSGGVAVKNKLTATKMPIEQQSESYGATTGTTSTGGTDSEEPSWWQDTSQQIDTSSALDCSFKDEMRFKVRHVDSGETAWWLRNDDEATLADDVATINQDEEDAEQKSNKSQEPGWWETTDDINDPNEGNEYQNDKNISFSDLDYKSKTYFNDHQEITDSESRPFPRSRLTPETDWWNDDDEEDDTNAKADELPKEKHLTSPPTPAVQNGTIQLKICRVESTDAAWWQQDESEGGDQTTTSNAQEEQKPSVEPETSSATTSSSSSMSAEPKKWWMTGPAKKLFNIPRVESGEKAWWQTENSDKESQHSKKSPPQERNTNPETESMAPQNSTIKKLFNLPRVESGEKAWWLEENSEKEDQHSNSQDSQQNNYQQPEEISNDPPPSASPPQNIKIKKLINIPRVESGEKAWWLEESPEQENKRSNSQDSECYPGLQETERQKSPNKKLFNLSRLDSDQEEESWWQHDGQERGKTRSRSRESEQEFRNSNRSDKRQQITPTKEQTNVWSPSTRTSQSPVKQIFSQPEEPDSYEANIVVEEEEVWPPPIGRTSESPMKRVFTQQQSLEEQKERWLQERNRHLQNQSTEDIYQNNPAGLEEPNYPHSYQLNTDDDDSHDHQTSFLPQNRVDSQTELSNSFNFEYSERPPPLGQCASPVHHEEEPPQRNNEPYCSSPYDNIPMTKVQQTPMANNAATIMDAISLMPISGASPPASSATPQLTMLENNKINVAAYQQTTMPTIAAENECGWRNVKSLAGNQRQTPPNQQYNQNDLRSKIERAFISRHQNIDELLSGACRPLSPMFFDNDESFQTMPPTQRNMFLEEITPDQVRIHDSRAQVSYIQRMDSRDDWENKDTSATASKTPPRLEPRAIDDAALQVYKDGDFGAYLDLESSLAEQAEEIEGLNSSRKNSLVVRTQLSVRVHAIIEKLLSAEGSDLRRALFSLKQVFQEDKDLVHAFVALGGLNCLVRVGNGADQNYQNYILRALGQVMLYVDGMNGVMKHEPTMQWLYSLIASNYRSVVKTALKLLLVFVEYAESNCHVLVSAIHSVDKQQGTLPWSNIMRLLKDYDNADAELVIYAASLINKTLGGLSDQDSFYDESDLLEQQGMESVIQHYLSKPGTDIDLINQLQLYEAVLKFEDGESDGIRLPDNTLRKTQRFRNSTDTAERRKSRRHSTGTSPGNINKVLPTHSRLTPPQTILDEDSSSSTNSAEYANGVFVDKQHRDGAGVTPGLRRRRERAERHRSFLKEQQEAAAAAVAAANGYLNGLEKREELASAAAAVPTAAKQLFDDGPATPHATTYTTSCSSGSASASTTALTSPQTSPGDYPPPPTSIAYNTITNTSVVPPPPPPPPPPPDLLGFLHMRPINFYNQTSPSSTTATTTTNTNNFSNNNNSNIATDAVDFLKISESDSEDKKRMLQLKRDHTVKDLTQKLCNLPTSPTHEDKLQNRIVGDMSGLISKAKEGLAKSKSKGEMSRASSVDQEIKKPEPKKSENELQWEELVRNMVRPLQLCDLDFTDLNSDDDKDLLAPRGTGRGVPPPPPPMGGVALPPPMLPQHIVLPPPMMSQSNTSNGSGTGYANSSLTNSLNSSLNGSINGDTLRKSKKTVKLFWKEVREDLIPPAVGKTIWDELPPATVDTQKLEHLFESRAKDLMSKKQQEMNKSKEVIVLDHKRSNAINIAMTKLPPPRAIKAAILKMDATVVTREGIDKLLNMLPTDEEKGKIQEAQMANPELPLGSAEQFLLTLASISELPARLRLWAFRLDFDNSEREIAEPLMDLKHGIEILRNNRTFKCILSTLLSVGIFLNGAPVKGFQIEYLAKVPEVKDTVHKHSLLHHLCHIVMESGMETTDLYSEIGPITRASKADFNELAYNLSQLEHECKASWDRLKLMCKHDCPPQLQQKLVDFLADCAERIIILQIVHRRVMNRYRKFLLWLGVPQHSVADSRPNEFCRILSEFALEYRTTRERVQQQIEKKANHRERNKTRGKLIVDIAKFKTKEDKQDAELKELLGTPSSDNADGTLTWRRRRAENLRSPQMRQSEENFTDGDDEILESLVKTATKAPGNRTTPRERKRTRHADRKSLRRTLKNGLTEEEKLQVAALIKTY
ncbi:formin homology 2 domain containing isoform X6 [Musca autumnalis]|uniref:formin homology 2 domain containing isoform X6 n=1 Tax=Musca autumnalis TaxID=221902 RepID=UPI003CE74C1D